MYLSLMSTLHAHERWFTKAEGVVGRLVGGGYCVHFKGPSERVACNYVGLVA